ncbi:unnamed protein product [Mycena citricolor]|uniref:Uncharacterized protein n=1 Tax=Mycena citricolor TaxID=2018698 RepID=A0AAD2HNH1_9AGAR|nr:unnamed protein product [Mycena citricolor]
MDGVVSCVWKRRVTKYVRTIGESAPESGSAGILFLSDLYTHARALLTMGNEEFSGTLSSTAVPRNPMRLDELSTFSWLLLDIPLSCLGSVAGLFRGSPNLHYLCSKICAALQRSSRTASSSYPGPKRRAGDLQQGDVFADDEFRLASRLGRWAAWAGGGGSETVVALADAHVEGRVAVTSDGRSFFTLAVGHVTSERNAVPIGMKPVLRKPFSFGWLVETPGVSLSYTRGKPCGSSTLPRQFGGTT